MSPRFRSCQPLLKILAHLLEVFGLLERFDLSLLAKESGYFPKERYDAIRGAYMRQEEMRRKVQDGEIRSLNRTRQEILRMKEEKGGLSSSTWFLKGKIANTIKCQAIPNGGLAKILTKPDLSVTLLQTPAAWQHAAAQLRLEAAACA